MEKELSLVMLICEVTVRVHNDHFQVVALLPLDETILLLLMEAVLSF